MFELQLGRWKKVWLSKTWHLGFDPATGMSELHGVKGYLVAGDISYLFNLAKWLPQGGCYLEVGSWQGLSALVFANGLLANLNLKATIYCIDTWLGSDVQQDLAEVRQGRLFELFTRNVREAQMDGFIKPVRGNSPDVARSWAGPQLDLIFIDGDHAEEPCYLDIRHWRPWLKRGGRILGHDAAPDSGVERALRRYCNEEGCFASICPMPQSHFIWEIHEDPNTLAANHHLLG